MSVPLVERKNQLGLLILLLVLPFVEFRVFRLVVVATGLWPAIIATIVTSLIGLVLLRLSGVGVMRRVESSISRGQFPAKELFDGLILMLAGIALLIPGFVTDAIGLILFLPPVRFLFFLWAKRKIRRITVSGGNQPGGQDPRTVIVDVDYEEVVDVENAPENSLPSGSGSQSTDDGQDQHNRE